MPVVLPAVPIEARRAYWVAVYVLSTSIDIKATNATVANEAAMSSKITAKANKISDFPDQANTEKEGSLMPLKHQRETSL